MSLSKGEVWTWRQMLAGRTPCDEGSRDRDKASISQGAQRLQANHQEPWWRPEADAPSQPPEGTNPDEHFILDFKSPEP